jgi:REP element-mobilizing transposase RayT
MERFYQRNLPHYRVDCAGIEYFVTWCLVKGQEPLTDIERDVVSGALQHWDRVRCRLSAYVVMDDHVHVMLGLLRDDDRLERLLQSWKAFTGHRLAWEFGRRRPVWQRESYDRVVRNDREFEELAQYIVDNPRKRWPEALDYRWLYVAGQV